MLHSIRFRAAALSLIVLMALGGAPAHASWFFGMFGGNTAEPGANEPAQPAVASVPQVQDPEERQTDESSVLRVKLSSLGSPVALGLTFMGQYTVDGDKGFRIADQTEASMALDAGSLLLTVGGLTIDMGTEVLFKRHAASNDADSALLIHENKYDTRYVGDLRLMVEDGAIVPVVHIDIDDYLYGVVPFEMSDSFPIEALKAQAVAARTYALSRRAANAGREYDVVDTTADQVFRGLNEDYENAIRAVDETRYVAGLYKDNYATCYFSASNGGQTAMPEQIWSYSGDYGYLDVRDDPYDLRNESSVVKRLNVGAQSSGTDAGILERLRAGLADQGLTEIGAFRITRIEPIEPKFGEGNRMYNKLRFYVRLDADAPEDQADGADAAQQDAEYSVDINFYSDLKPNFALKINAANCELVSVVTHYAEGEDADTEGALPVSFDIESRRFGHGVGMSQRGAQQMAKEDWNWLEILAFYYPGMQLCKMDFQTPELTAIEALPASIGYARARPTPKPTPAPLPALGDGEYYARVKLQTKSSKLNVREGASTESALVGTLSNDQRVIVMKELPGGWAEIKTAELKGNVSMEYLVRE